MNYRDTNKGLRQYELSRDRKDLLSRLEEILSKATRKRVQDALRLPDRLRTRYIETNSVYRSAVRQLLAQRLESHDAVDDQEKREVMQQIIDSIDGLERIDADIKRLEENGTNGDNDGNGPKDGEEDAA